MFWSKKKEKEIEKYYKVDAEKVTSVEDLRTILLAILADRFYFTETSTIFEEVKHLLKEHKY